MNPIMRLRKRHTEHNCYQRNFNREKAEAFHKVSQSDYFL